MTIVVIGGTGRIGSKLIDKLTEHGHDAVAVDLRTGVNTLPGEGLVEALADAEVVVDVSDSPSFETRRSWASSRRQLATSWPPSGRPASDTTWRCRSWAPIVFPTAATCEPGSPRRS